MSKDPALAKHPSIYLASKSPRRMELLRQIGVEFEELFVRESGARRRDVMETPRKDEAALDYVKRIARTKAAVGWHQMNRRKLPPRPVLAADTEVVIDGELWHGSDSQDRLIVDVAEGRHTIEIRKAGYRTYVTEVQVRRGESTPLNVCLRSQNER